MSLKKRYCDFYYFQGRNMVYLGPIDPYFFCRYFDP